MRHPLARHSRRGGDQDRGVGLLLAFTAGVFLMVLLIVLIAVFNRGWMLIPVIAIDIAVTAAILTSIARLLDD